MRHKLTAKDEQSLKATCSVCGPTELVRMGKNYQCKTARKDSARRWREQNPEAVRKSRASKNPHTLSQRDHATGTAFCGRCESRVDLVPWARGYICGNRARELRTKQQDAPLKPCSSCWAEVDPEVDGRPRIVVYPRGGVCPRCTDPDAADLGAGLRALLERPESLPPGLYVETPLEQLDDTFNAVPRWKTLGSDRPWNEVEAPPRPSGAGSPAGSGLEVA